MFQLYFILLRVLHMECDASISAIQSVNVYMLKEIKIDKVTVGRLFTVSL